MVIASTNVTMRAGGATWRKNARLIYEYLRREMSDATEQRKLLYPKTWNSQVQRTVPLIWRMARELSTLYLRPPAREFEGASGDQVTAIIDTYDAAKVNRRLRTAQEHLSVLQNATVWVWLTSDGFRLLTPPIHDQWAWSKRVDAQEVDDVTEWRVRFPVSAGPTSLIAQTAVALITPERAIWESGPAGWEGKGIWEPDGRNPFGRIPVVYLRGCDPAPGEFFVPVPEDMLDAQRAVNHDFTDRGSIARKQGFAQGWIEGLTQAQANEIETGPESWAGLPTGGKMGFASPQSSLAEYGADTDSFVKLVIACSGMSPATVMKSTGITALAKIVENIDREVERQRAKDEFVAAEQRLYELIADATKIRSGGLSILPAKVRVKVKHREPIQPADPINDAQAKSLRVQLALDCAASIIAEERAIELDAAQEIAKRNMELSRELAPMSTPTQPSSSETSDGTQPQSGAPPALETGGGADVQKAALNGAQVQAMGEILDAVARGQRPMATARAQLLASFPLDEKAVDDMLAPLAGFQPATTPTQPSSVPPVRAA